MLTAKYLPAFAVGFYKNTAFILNEIKAVFMFSRKHAIL